MIDVMMEVARLLKEKGLDADCRRGPQGVEIVTVGANTPDDCTWAFGTSGGLHWGGDIYLPNPEGLTPLAYYDSVELPLPADCPDPEAIAAAIAYAVAHPPGPEGQLELEGTTP